MKSGKRKPDPAVPIRVRGGELYWDFTVTAVRQRKDGQFKITVMLNRTKRKATGVGRWPVPLMLRLLVSLTTPVRPEAR